DTYVNIMAQYHPDYEVGSMAVDGSPRYATIDRRLRPDEVSAAYEAARRAGLWRFDRRGGD
ncbi:MAG: radical SAM protein, partial [Planctomycetes bacterium]|nr:radical SAM protein [Planctomycetota bacterium]